VNISPVSVVNNNLHDERIKSLPIIVISRPFLWSNKWNVCSIYRALRKTQVCLEALSNFHYSKSSPLGNFITSGKSTSVIAWQTSLTIWQAVLFPIPNFQPRECRPSPVARCQKQMAKRFSTLVDLLNLISFFFSVSFHSWQIKRRLFRESKVRKLRCVLFPLAYRFLP